MLQLQNSQILGQDFRDVSMALKHVSPCAVNVCYSICCHTILEGALLGALSRGTMFQSAPSFLCRFRVLHMDVEAICY